MSVLLLLFFISFILFPLQNCFGFLMMDELLIFLKAFFCLSVKSDKISPFLHQLLESCLTEGQLKRFGNLLVPMTNYAIYYYSQLAEMRQNSQSFKDKQT